MPELPEVETMVRGIRPFVEGRRVIDFKGCPTHCRPISILPPCADVFHKIQNQVVTTVGRMGKRIVLEFANRLSLVIEPRMTGLVLMSHPPDTTHLRFELKFSGRRQFNSIWFWDRRGLGTVRLFDPDQRENALGKTRLGPDALEITEAQWRERLGRTRRAIKTALLDQKLVAGIGNIYASEILHRARIDPQRCADSLNSNELKRLAVAVRSVLELAIELEGSTLGDGTYRNALNKPGQYQNEHRVYMRDGEQCTTCNRARILRMVQTQRSTFHCSYCQK